MPRLRHEKQRAFHELRHGPRHLRKHLVGKPHPHTRQRASISEREHRRRRRIGLSMLGIGLALVVVLLVASGSALLKARSSLEQARRSITALQDNQDELTSAAGRRAAAAQLKAAQTNANAAVGTLTSSGSLHALAKIPFIGSQVNATEDLARDVASTAEVGQRLLIQVDAVTRSSSGTTVSLSNLSHLRSSVDQGAADLLLLERPSGGLVPPIGSARDTFNTELAKVADRLKSAGSILRYLQYFVGGQGARTYLLAAENESEMRDQGAVLSLAQVHGNDGSVTVDSPVSIGEYQLSHPAPFPLAPGMQELFGLDLPTQTWQSANMTASFPWTGGDLSAMYLQATGTQTDGVVGVDVHALSTVLRFSGPVEVPGVTGPITSGNVSWILLQQLYAKNPSGNQTARKDLLSTVATEAFSKLHHSQVDLAAFAHALSAEIAGRHLLFYDAQPSNEALLTASGASGAVDTVEPRRTFHLAIENAAANKVDVFLTTAIHQHVEVSSQGSATVITKVTIHNGAPTSRVPTYQLGPNSTATRVPGEYAGIAYLWSPRGSQPPNGVKESGLVASAHNLDILPGASETITFATVIPHALRDGHLLVRWIPQSTSRPQRLAVTVAGPGLAGTPGRQSAILDQPTMMNW